MRMRRRRLLCLGAMLAAACAPTIEPQRLDHMFTALARLAPPAHAERPVAALDGNQDGNIDREDVAALKALAARFGQALAARNIVVNPLHKLYQGPDPALPGVLARRERRSDVLAGTGLPADTLVTLYVETRWMAAQAALALGQMADAGRFGGSLAANVPGYRADHMEPAAVCVAVEQLELTSYVTAGLGAPAVVFDLDSTVWPGNVMDPFLAVLVEERLPRPDANPKLIAFLKTVPGVDTAQVERNDVVANAKLLLERSTDAKLPAEQKVSTKDSFYNIVALLKGMPVAEAERAARRVFAQGSTRYPPWSTQLFADRDGCGMRRIIKTLQKRGVRVYLLSAGLDVLSWAAADALGVPRHDALGSLLAVHDGAYTGEVRDSTYATKAPVTRQWLVAPPILVFGDSPQSDFDMMLEAAAAAFMVNPRPAFQERDDKEAGGRFVAVSFDGTEKDLGAP